MMNGLPSVTTSSEVKYPPKVANNRAQANAEVDTEKLYETKPNKKIVRIFTVILYMFSVSLGAILLSLYYIFIWKNPLNSGTFYEQSMQVAAVNTTCPPTTCPYALVETTQHEDLSSTEPSQMATEKNIPPIINHQNVEFLYIDGPSTVTNNNGDLVTPSEVDATGTGGLVIVSALENINSDALQAFLKKRSLPTGASEYTPVNAVSQRQHESRGAL